jgi:hypothetical protein
MFRSGGNPVSGYHEDIRELAPRHDCVAGARTEGKVELLSILAPATQKGQVEKRSFSYTRPGLAWTSCRTGDGVVDAVDGQARVRRLFCTAAGHAYTYKIRSSRRDQRRSVPCSLPYFYYTPSQSLHSPCLPPRPSQTAPYPKRNTTFRHPSLRSAELRSLRRCTRSSGTRTRHGEILSSIPTASFVCSSKRASIIYLLCPRLSKHRLYALLDVPGVFNHPYSQRAGGQFRGCWV